MALIDEKNAQAKIIFDVLWWCELNALFGKNTNLERSRFIRSKLSQYKHRRWAYLSLKKIMRSPNISEYVDSILKEMVHKNNTVNIDSKKNFAAVTGARRT